MAVKVGYYEDTNECYSEGPFVIVYANGWRIEAGHKGMKCPSLPCHTVIKFIKGLGIPVKKYHSEEEASSVCDTLNQLVKDGSIPVDNDGYPTFILY